jgi:hypothetical protein
MVTKADTVYRIVPDAREVFSEQDLSTFSRLVEERLAITNTIKSLEEDKKRLDEGITSFLTDANTPSVQYGEHPVQIIQGSRSNLSKEKLVELGVSVMTIKQATTTTTYSYLKVGGRG